MHEARRHAQVADELMRDGYSLSSTALEMLMRNIAGLHLADLHEDGSLMDEMEWSPVQNLVPRDIVRSVLQDNKRKKTLTPPAEKAGRG